MCAGFGGADHLCQSGSSADDRVGGGGAARAALHAILHHSKPDGSPYPREKCPISAAFKDGAVHHIDTEVFWRKDGTSFPVAYTSTPIRDEQGRLAGAVVTFRDITERKRFQDTLSKSEREHRLVTDNVPALIACVDKDGRYVLANRQYEEWFGVANDQLIGRHVREVHTEASYQAAQPYVEQALSGQEAAFELQIPHKDGSRRWISATYVPKLEEDGRVGGFYALVLDVTGRRRAEAENLELQKQLHRSQKLEAIGTLAGGIAHEFNNLLFVILGNTERTLLKLSEGSPLRPIQEDVLTASKRAKGMVEQILAFSRRSEGASQPVQFNVLVKETLKLLRATLPATIEFRTHIDDTCGPVLGDIARLQQIIMNLCTNAYQAMGETGLLGVHVAAVEITAGSEPHAPDLKPGSYVLLEVSDTGSGMDAQTLERIFEPFFSTHEVGKGTGLGLPSVYGFVTAMGGVIKVDSVVGKGTTFRVYLPQCETGATRQQEQGPAIPEEAGGADILVVDDEPLVLSTLQGLLEALGYAVTVCETGRGALEFVRAEPDRFRLVITDQTMPQMTGLELTGQLHQIRPDLPVILVSGYTNVISERDFQQHGVCTLLAKPVGFADLKRSVQEALVDHGRR